MALTMLLRLTKMIIEYDFIYIDTCMDVEVLSTKKENVMGQFDHYPDMNQDGKKDLYDCVTFHEMMGEDEKNNKKNTYKSPDSFSVTTKKELVIFLGVLWAIYIIVRMIAK